MLYFWWWEKKLDMQNLIWYGYSLVQSLYQRVTLAAVYHVIATTDAARSMMDIIFAKGSSQWILDGRPTGHK